MKVALLIDANHFLHRTVRAAAHAKAAETSVPFDMRADYDGDRAILMRRLAEGLSKDVERFQPLVEQVVYCVDSPSWRKLVYAEYKGNRTKDESMDWGAVYRVHGEFCDAVAAQGFTVSRIPGAEADDVMFFWSQSLNHCDKRSAIVMSGDGDLLQLVGHDQATGAFTLVHNKLTQTLHVFKGFDRWVREEEAPGPGALDIFDLPDTMFGAAGRKALLDAAQAAGLSTLEVDTPRYVFKKILTGDSGDNVPSLFSRVKETKAGPRNFGLTEAMAARILDAYESEFMMVSQANLFDAPRIARIVELAVAEMCIGESECTPKELVSRWERNRDLVYLHINCIPPVVIERLQTDYDAGKGARASTLLTGDLLATVGLGAPAVGGPSAEKPAGGFDGAKWKKYKL